VFNLFCASLTSRSIGGKYICLYDLRSGLSHRIGAKSPQCLAISPHEPNLLACHSRLSQDIEIYDLRQFSGMTSSIHDVPVSHLSWCPTR
jgi:hypothetical protein